MKNLNSQNIMVFLLFCLIGSLFFLGIENGDVKTTQEKSLDIQSLNNTHGREPSIPEPFPDEIIAILDFEENDSIMGRVTDNSTKEFIKANVKVYNRQGIFIGEAISSQYDGIYLFKNDNEIYQEISPYYIVASKEGYVTSSRKYLAYYSMVPTIDGHAYKIDFNLQPI